MAEVTDCTRNVEGGDLMGNMFAVDAKRLGRDGQVQSRIF